MKKSADASRVCARKDSARTRFKTFRKIHLRAIERVALRRLDMLDAAADMATLAAVPGNRLERLRGDRKNQYSIRINDQWRICFAWKDGNAHIVEIVDYH
jgi:toxin HigB-1